MLRLRLPGVCHHHRVKGWCWAWSGRRMYTLFPRPSFHLVIYIVPFTILFSCAFYNVFPSHPLGPFFSSHLFTLFPRAFKPVSLVPLYHVTSYVECTPCTLVPLLTLFPRTFYDHVPSHLFQHITIVPLLTFFSSHLFTLCPRAF